MVLLAAALGLALLALLGFALVVEPSASFLVTPVGITWGCAMGRLHAARQAAAGSRAGSASHSASSPGER